MQKAAQLEVIDSVAARIVARFHDFEPPKGWKDTASVYPAMATGHFLEKIAEPNPSDPIYRQIAPDSAELRPGGEDDPVKENLNSPCPGLLHRYHDRVLILVTSNCFVRCRHCMRKRLWGEPPHYPRAMPAWVEYLNEHREVREVILSGGDPMTLPDKELEKLIANLSAVKSVKTIRVHSRVLPAQPDKINTDIAAMLADYGVKRMVVQINHFREICEKTREAVEELNRHDIEVLNQSVLLKGVNDNPVELAELWKALSEIGIYPYYLHHPDPARGAMHFFIPLERGYRIYNCAAQLDPEIAPQYVVDLPGASKMPVEKLVPNGKNAYA